MSTSLLAALCPPCVWRQVHFAVYWVLVFDSRKTDNENKDDDVSDDEFDHKARGLLVLCWWTLVFYFASWDKASNQYGQALKKQKTEARSCTADTA